MIIVHQKYSASVSGLKGVVYLEGDERSVQLHYVRHSKLGARLLSNAGGERQILANYIRQELGLPRGEGFSTHFTFVGV